MTTTDETVPVPDALCGEWAYSYLEGHAAGPEAGWGLSLNEDGTGSARLPGRERATRLRVVEASAGTGGRKASLRFVLVGEAGGGELKLKREDAGRGSVEAGGLAMTFTAERDPADRPEPAAGKGAAAWDPGFRELALKKDAGFDGGAVDAAAATRLRERFPRVLGDLTDAMPVGFFRKVAKELKVHKGDRIEQHPREQALLFEHAMFDLPGDDGPSHARRVLLDAASTGDPERDAARVAVAEARWSVVVVQGEASGGVRVVQDLLHFQRLPVLDEGLASAQDTTVLAVRLVPRPGVALRLGAAYIVDQPNLELLNRHTDRLLRSPTPPTPAGTRRLARQLLAGAFRRHATRVPLDA